MSVILLEKDPFVDAPYAAWSDSSGDVNVRRPLWGIVGKRDRHAFLAVYQPNGRNIVPVSLTNSSAPGGSGNANHNFILQNVQMQLQEKMQIVETFGPHFAFFYGERPSILQCTGFLLNTVDFDWKNEWLSNYEKFLRGTRCVENRSRVYLGFDDVLVEGYIVATSVNYSADMPYLCPFAFQFLVTNYLEVGGVRVLQQEDARVVGQITPETDPGAWQTLALNGKQPFYKDEQYAEYLSPIESQDHYVIDEATGISYRLGDPSPEVPVTATPEPSPIPEVSGSDPGANSPSGPSTDQEVLREIAKLKTEQAIARESLKSTGDSVNRAYAEDPGTSEMSYYDRAAKVADVLKTRAGEVGNAIVQVSQ